MLKRNQEDIGSGCRYNRQDEKLLALDGIHFSSNMIHAYLQVLSVNFFLHRNLVSTDMMTSLFIYLVIKKKKKQGEGTVLDGLYCGNECFDSI